MNRWEPPADVEPDRLFRLLLTFPRPVMPLVHRVAGAEDVALYARALRSTELAWALDGAADLPTDLGASSVVSRLLAVALCLQDGTPAFGTPEEVGALPEHEVVALFRETDRALRVVSPTYLSADIGAWSAALKQGAMATANLCDALALGGCCSVSWGFGKKAVHLRDEPERYFGCAQRDLLDCHWMVYRAAQTYKFDLEKKVA